MRDGLAEILACACQCHSARGSGKRKRKLDENPFCKSGSMLLARKKSSLYISLFHDETLAKLHFLRHDFAPKRVLISSRILLDVNQNLSANLKIQIRKSV